MKQEQLKSCSNSIKCRCSWGPHKSSSARHLTHMHTQRTFCRRSWSEWTFWMNKPSNSNMAWSHCQNQAPEFVLREWKKINTSSLHSIWDHSHYPRSHDFWGTVSRMGHNRCTSWVSVTSKISRGRESREKNQHMHQHSGCLPKSGIHGKYWLKKTRKGQTVWMNEWEREREREAILSGQDNGEKHKNRASIFS